MGKRMVVRRGEARPPMGSFRRCALGCRAGVELRFHGKLTRKPVTFLTTGDAVNALRIGRGWTTVAQDEPYYDGWIVLLDAQGRGQVASVDEVVDGDVLWSDRGVFFGRRAMTT